MFSLDGRAVSASVYALREDVGICSFCQPRSHRSQATDISSFSLEPCLLLESLNEEGKCLKHVPSRSSSPADSRTVFTLPRAEQTRFEAARAQASSNTSSRVFQRHASRVDHHPSDPARHAFSTKHCIGAFCRARCAIKMKKRARQQRAQTTFTLRTARGDQQYHCARKPQKISELVKSLEREYHTISHV